MVRPEKDEFMLGIQQELKNLDIKNQYKRMQFRDYSPNGKGDYYVHQIMVTGLVCRAMYITFIPGTNSNAPEIHVSDRMYFEYSNKDWHLVLADPKSNPQLIVDFFKDLKAVGDKYGRTVPLPPPPASKTKPTPILINPTPFSQIVKP